MPKSLSVKPSQSVRIEELSPEELPKAVIRLAWPVVLETTLFGLGGIINTMLVGRLGAAALAAVGLGQQIEFMIQVSFAAVTVGATAVVSRHVGAREWEEAHRTVAHALLLALALGLGFLLLLWWLAEPAMRAMRARGEVIGLGTTYLRTVVFSFVPSFLLASGGSVFRGAGNTRIPMVVMAVVTLSNIVLGYFLIYGGLGFPSLGVRGAALAATLSRTVGAVGILTLLLRGKRLLKLRWADLRHPSPLLIRRIFNIGLPAGVEQVQFQLAMTLYTVIISSLGTKILAAHSIAMRIEGLAFMPGFGFGMAAMTLVGQSLGAGKPDLGQKAAFLAQRYAMLVMSAVGLFLFFFGARVATWFIADAAVVALAAWALKIWALAMPMMGTSNTLAGGLRGAGDTRRVLLIMSFCIWVTRLPLAYLLALVLRVGPVGAWAAAVLDINIRGGLLWRRFLKGDWKKIRV